MIKNKTAIVTGAGSKIAKAIIASIEKDHFVVKHKLQPENSYYHGNLSNESHVIEFLSKINHIDLLICCAGGIKALHSQRPKPDDCIDITLSQSQELFNRNFFSTFLCCKHSIKKMKEQSNIIIIGSAVVSKPREKAEVGMYACAKAAVHEYTIHLAKELEGKIRVNCIATDGHELQKIVDAVNNILISQLNGQVIRLEQDHA